MPECGTQIGFTCANNAHKTSMRLTWLAKYFERCAVRASELDATRVHLAVQSRDPD